jgi:hypothetical protein
MIISKRARGLLAGVLVAGTAAWASGAIILNSPRTFTAAGVDGWAADTVTLDNPLAGGNPGGFLEITFPYGGPPSPLGPAISNTTSVYTGDYSGLVAGGAIRFDFYAGSQPPTANPAILLHTSDGDTWSYAFTYTLGQVGTWVTYSVPLSGAGWTGGSGFVTDIQNVTWVGLDLEGNAGVGGTQIFGLDNWTYVIPEPGTLYMLTAALLGLTLTFRRPLGEAIERMKKSA